VDIDQLTKVLADRWRNPQVLAKYMVRYWPALKYSSSATGRQRTCTSLALLQIGCGVVVLWKVSAIIGVSLLVEGLVLWAMATQVNRPLSMYTDRRVRKSRDAFCRTEWRNSVGALIAYAELCPSDENANYLANRLLSDEETAHEVLELRQ
jgi:hypothetical protein